MGNVTLPTPVFLAGGAICLVAGYLVGSVAGPGTPDRTTAKVVSYDAGKQRLCLQGDATQGQTGVDSNGVLCGTWRRTPGAGSPRAGEQFRFVSMSSTAKPGSGGPRQVVIYGDVLG